MKSFFSAALLGLTVWSSAVHASLFSDDEARRAILDLRALVTTQQNTLAELEKQTQQSGRSQLELLNQIEALRRDNATLRGMNETLQKDLADMQRRQRDVYADLDARLKKIEPQRVTIDGKEADVGPDELRQYNAALDAFRASKFAESSQAFSAFLRQFPKSAYAPTSQFWLGSAQYALRDFKSAVLTLQTFVRDNPTHLRAPDALFNIGNSQLELNDKKAARATFQSIIKQYPNTPAAQNARERVAMTL